MYIQLSKKKKKKKRASLGRFIFSQGTGLSPLFPLPQSKSVQQGGGGGGGGGDKSVVPVIRYFLTDYSL